MLATSALLSFRDLNDQEHLDGCDIEEGSAVQDFDPQSNTPMVTLGLKSAEKFGEVTTTIKYMGAPDNLLVIWMDFEEGDSFAAEAEKEETKFISAPRVSETLNRSEERRVGKV